jgi:photosystem II stability/assembly factor-like uncharacterized protein
MTRKRTLVFLLFGVAVLAAAAFLVSRSFSADETTVSALAEDTHFHGIAVDPRDANRLYLATHHGVFTVGPDGKARRVSETEDDFMGFTPHPADPEVLYASGHPAGGGNLGFIVSRDGGRSWSKLAEGVGGPVDFHQMDVSKADPKVVYGVYGDLQKSADGGRSWSRVGPAPEGIIGLAASSEDADRVYAATQRGLMVSTDGGRRWQSAHEARQAATMVHVTPDGTVYAFIAGTGLIRAEEPNLDWTILSNGFDGEFVLHLAAGAGGEQPILYAVTVNPETRAQALHVSRDGGRSWSPLAEG